MNIILFGAPGAGKGTQSALLVDKLDMRHISTGDLFRTAIQNETPLGLKAKEIMDAGNLVPDEIVIGMVEEVLSNLNGQSFILDGFPRTEAQAQALEGLATQLDVSIDAVISLAVPTETLISRLSSRRVCKGCGAVYNTISKPPRTEGVCDVCEGEVVQRKDDKEDVISVRLDNYEKSTRPVKDFYQKLNKFIEIDGTGSTQDIYQRIVDILK